MSAETLCAREGCGHARTKHGSITPCCWARDNDDMLCECNNFLEPLAAAPSPSTPPTPTPTPDMEAKCAICGQSFGAHKVATNACPDQPPLKTFFQATLGEAPTAPPMTFKCEHEHGGGRETPCAHGCNDRALTEEECYRYGRPYAPLHNPRRDRNSTPTAPPPETTPAAEHNAQMYGYRCTVHGFDYDETCCGEDFRQTHLAPESPAVAASAPLGDEPGLRPLTPDERALVDEFAREMQERVIPEVIDVMHRRRAAWNAMKDTPLRAVHPNDATWRELHNAWRKRAEEAESRLASLSSEHAESQEEAAAFHWQVEELKVTAERLAKQYSETLGNLVEIQALHEANCALVRKQNAQLEESRRELDSHKEAVAWACGERGEFRPPLNPSIPNHVRTAPFWWRAELRLRASLPPSSGAKNE